MRKLTALDSRIIRELLRDGRKSFAEIAADCRVTKNKVWKRYASMVKKGIIVGATVQVDFSKFGYDALATFLINVDAHQIEQVMAYVGQLTEVRAFRQYNSIYNIRALATLRDLNELDQLKQAIKRKLPTMGLRTYLWTNVRNIPENLSLAYPYNGADKNWRDSRAPEHPQGADVKIDDMDEQIVRKLTSDGRASFAQIAEEVGTSVDTIMKRYHKLRGCGALKVSIQIDPSKVGYTSILEFNISFASSHDLSTSVVESLANVPDVVTIAKISGDYDLLLTAIVRDLDHYFKIQDQISRIRGVTKMEANARKAPEKWPSPMQYISTM